MGASLLNVAPRNLTVRVVPDKRGGALSAVSAFRFGGAALAPVAWLPLYHVHPSLAFAAAGSSLLVAAGALPALRGLEGERPKGEGAHGAER